MGTEAGVPVCAPSWRGADVAGPPGGSGACFGAGAGLVVTGVELACWIKAATDLGEAAVGEAAGADFGAGAGLATGGAAASLAAGGAAGFGAAAAGAAAGFAAGASALSSGGAGCS